MIFSCGTKQAREPAAHRSGAVVKVAFPEVAQGPIASRDGRATPCEAGQGSYFPGSMEPRQTTKKALTAAIQEDCSHGGATRSVDDLVQDKVGDGVSKSQHIGGSGVSQCWIARLREEIDQGANAFLDRPIRGDCLIRRQIQLREGS